ncbi:hypothetical protein DFJ77DRAFT_325572 [Powellomyces hirtus]|nr:hypothetical protein DFJ77DRAFT_325572 [Powellomyces hirtus]
MDQEQGGLFTPVEPQLPPEIWRIILFNLHPSDLQLVARRVCRAWNKLIQELMPRSLLKNVKVKVFGMMLTYDSSPFIEPQTRTLVGISCSWNELTFVLPEEGNGPWHIFDCIHIQHNLWKTVFPCVGKTHSWSDVKVSDRGVSKGFLYIRDGKTPWTLHYTVKTLDVGRFVRIDRITINPRELITWKGVRRIRPSLHNWRWVHADIRQQRQIRRAKLCVSCQINMKAPTCDGQQCGACCLSGGCVRHRGRRRRPNLYS